MADTGVFATTAEVQLWMPTWVSSTYNAESYINEFIGCWESYINNNDQFVNLSDSYSTNNIDLKLTAHGFVCAMVAMQVATLDPSGTDIRTYETFMDLMTNAATTFEKRLMKNEIISNVGKSS